MEPKIKIAVDAMGGENSPRKIIDGILENHKKNEEVIEDKGVKVFIDSAAVMYLFGT